MSTGMKNTEWAVAADHAGYALKETLKATLMERGVTVRDFGAMNDAPTDYPDFAQALARWIGEGEQRRGVLLCGSGIGMSIAANRFPAVRAALCRSPEDARLARAHNDANVLCLGARLTDEKTAKECLARFIDTAFERGRHVERVKKLGGCDA